RDSSVTGVQTCALPILQRLRKAIPQFHSLLPADVKLAYEFDQSVYVINAVKSLVTEGAMGAVLTGLMVLLFLGDKRGALIVILKIGRASCRAGVCIRGG